MTAITAFTGQPAEQPAGRAVRVRLRLLAAVLPVTAVLYMGAEAVNPKGTDELITSTAIALRLLPIVAAHSSQLYLSGSLSVLGALGAFAGAVYNILGGINLAIAASAHMSQLAAAQVLVASFGSVPAHAAEYVYFASEFVAPVVMGVALWRSRQVPRWLAVLFTVGLEVAEQMGAIGPLAALPMLPFAAAMILLAVRLGRAAAGPATATRQAHDDAGQLARSSEGI